MSNRLSRRELAVAALAGAALRAQEKKYNGALDGATAVVDPKQFDPVAWTLERQRQAPLKLTFHAANRKQAEVWQRQFRAKVVELIGGFPDARPPLKPQTLEVREFPGYKREKFTFESRPGVGVLAYLLTPTASSAPHATVVCIPGHGRGVDDIVGIDEHGNDRTTKVGYAYDFAIQVAEHGMAAVAIEPMAFGCRRDARTSAHGLGASACEPAAGSALLLGETMIGWRVYDVMRTIDWIATRPELDSKRVGCMGISGGGTCTLFATALDPRIQAAFVSGYLNTFRDSIMSMSHCIDNYVPGILNWGEQYDVAALIAPRPLFSEGGDRDPIFPVAATRENYQRVKKVYEVFGVPNNIKQEIFSGVHEFHGAQGLPFLKEKLA
jgi:dienelactone hydrolase